MKHIAKIKIKTFERQTGATTKLVKKFLAYNKKSKSEKSKLVFIDLQRKKLAIANHPELKNYLGQIESISGNINFFKEEFFINTKLFVDEISNKQVIDFVKFSYEHKTNLVIHQTVID